MNWNRVESLRCRSKGFNTRVPPNNSSTQYFNPTLLIHHLQPGFFNKPFNLPLTVLTSVRGARGFWGLFMCFRSAPGGGGGWGGNSAQFVS